MITPNFTLGIAARVPGGKLSACSCHSNDPPSLKARGHVQEEPNRLQWDKILLKRMDSDV
jgi:hypothetical protein